MLLLDPVVPLVAADTVWTAALMPEADRQQPHSLALVALAHGLPRPLRFGDAAAVASCRAMSRADLGMLPTRLRHFAGAEHPHGLLNHVPK